MVVTGNWRDLMVIYFFRVVLIVCDILCYCVILICTFRYRYCLIFKWLQRFALCSVAFTLLFLSSKSNLTSLLLANSYDCLLSLLLLKFKWHDADWWEDYVSNGFHSLFVETVKRHLLVTNYWADFKIIWLIAVTNMIAIFL